jgi:hypothetical protein
MLEPERVAVIVHSIQEKQLVSDNAGGGILPDILDQGSVT